jgi:hypothetical protein
VDEASRVRVNHAGGDLAGNARRLSDRERRLLHEVVFERPARDVLQDDVRATARLAVVVDASHVGVRAGCVGAGLALEPEAVGVGRQELDRHAPVELQVVGEPDRGHSAAAERVPQPVAPGEHVAFPHHGLPQVPDRAMQQPGQGMSDSLPNV